MIKLFYYNNVSKFFVDSIDFSNIQINDLETSIFQIYTKHGYKVESTVEHLWILVNGKMIPFELESLNNDDLSVIYSAVISPNNAKEFSRQNGIIYYINPKEKPHLHFPHVHAKDNGDTISISLRNYSVTGSFKSRSKQKEAVAFVKKNKRKLLKEWNSIMLQLN